MKFIMLALSLFLPLGAHAQAIDERLITGPNVHLDLSNVSGDVRILGWDKDEIHLTGELGRNAELQLDHDEQDVRVKIVKKPGALRSMRPTHLNLRVPFATRLSVYVVSADVEVQGVVGEQQIQAVSGNIDVDGFAREMTARAVSGEISLVGTDVPGTIKAVSVSGDIEIGGVAGEVDARSVSGDTQIAGISFDHVQMKSTSGDIDFRGAINPQGRFEGEVISGTVELELADATGLEVDIKTHSGDIDNCFGKEAQRKSRHGPGLTLAFKSGAGDREVRVRSLSGDVRLCAQ